jgi:poly(hydroxyalkanoate) depolymerase family esterase
MRRTVDWRDLYASNRAVIERAHEAAGLTAPQTQTTIAAGRTRRALVHTPANGDPGVARPLVCMLHGCTQDAATVAAATQMNDAADRHGFIVVYPQQERGENAQRCWNWFDGRHQARGAGEPASIAAVVRDLVGTTTPWAVDPRRVFVAGLSAGGAMAAVMGAAYPDLFAAVAVHSGLAYRSAGSVRAAFAAMARGGRKLPALPDPLPSIVIHGSEDRTVAPANGEQVLAQSMGGAGLDVAHPTSSTRGRVPGGHTYEHARWLDAGGAPRHERLIVQGMGHAWSGGLPGGSYTDPRGPDATEAIWSFFATVSKKHANLLAPAN